PPTVTLLLTPNTLWPPDHRLVGIDAQITVSDAIDPNPHVVLLSVTSNEPGVGLGSGDRPNDIQDVTPLTDDRHFLLRAERAGTGNGRVYTVNYYVYDAASNGRVVAAVVVV